MSDSYFLYCVDCGTCIRLGKMIRAQGIFENQPGFGYSSLGGTSKGQWKANELASAMVQQFFVVHRGHELRVIPDTIDQRAPEVEFLFPDEDDRGRGPFSIVSFFALDVARPDAEEDANAIPQRALDRMLTKGAKR